MAFGPAAGLAIVDALRRERALENYHLLPSVRGDLLTKLGRFDEARDEFERAAALTRNERERALLLDRARANASAESLPYPACGRGLGSGQLASRSAPRGPSLARIFSREPRSKRQLRLWRDVLAARG